MNESELTIEELKHELDENGKYLDEFSAHIGVPDALIAKLNRLAALEAVCREIVDLQARTYGKGIELHLAMIDMAQKLKAVLEEA